MRAAMQVSNIPFLDLRMGIIWLSICSVRDLLVSH